MTELTLFVKAYNSNQLKQIDDLLQSQYEELDIKTTITANPQNKWVQLNLEGEDEVVATAYARKQIGICPVSLDNVEEGQVLKGYISKVDESHGQLIVDVGVFEPKVVSATISHVTLRDQFLAPKEVTMGKIAEAYALAEGLPISIKVTAKSDEALKAELSEEQLARLKGWQQSLLDRLIVTRANKELVDTALERTHLERDVIDVEQLGFFEFALTCKLGTEARGLIPRVGRYMRWAVFVVFAARKSVDFLAE
jgi:hypothetical protein